MNTSWERWSSGALLGLAAIAIWCNDLSWTPEIADTLPLALGLAAAVALGKPWSPTATPSPSPYIISWLIPTSLLGFSLGWVSHSITLLAVSFSSLCHCWERRYFLPHPHRSRILLLVLLSFPWLVLDWPSIGWHFRISAASSAESLFNALSLPTSREGTRFIVMGLPIDVKPSCAGWNLLQLSLLSGVALGILELPHHRRFWLLVALLPAFAWFANLLRIIALSIIGLSFDADLASGTLHSLTGLATLALVLFVIRSFCLWLASLTPPKV